MNLIDIRKLFIDHSGRFDLIVNTETYADNGADFFIRTGQRVLDNMVNVSENDAILSFSTVAGEELLTVPGVRTIDRIWLYDPDNEAKRFLIQTFLQDFKNAFGENKSTGLPTHYAIVPLRNNGPIASDLQSKGILLGPAPNKEYQLRLLGRFYSHTLTGNTDQNFWSLNYPHTLVQAALYALERFYRNTEGMRDHMEAIEQDVQGIDFEEVEASMRGRTNMADSFNERIYVPRRSQGF